MSNQIKGTLNHVEVVGWLGQDPKQRFLPNGNGVCELSVATKRVGSKDTNGDYTYETEWINIEAWDRLGDVCQTNLHKGSRVRIVGTLRTFTWDDRETGERRRKTVVRANDVMFLNDLERTVN